MQGTVVMESLLSFGVDRIIHNGLKSPFYVGDVLYNCAEQYMIWKARCFNDPELNKIMSTVDPQLQKRFKWIENFDPVILVYDFSNDRKDW